jgi:hypothetical protein
MYFLNLINEPLFVLQLITLLLFVASLITGILLIVRHKDLRLFIIPLLTYIIHVIIFYSVLVFTDYITKTANAAILNGWSSGIRLHLVLILLSEFIMILKGDIKWPNYK